MKRISLLISVILLCIFSASSLLAQHHFPKDSAEWKVWHRFTGVPSSSYLTEHKIKGSKVLLGSNHIKLSSGFRSWDSYFREVDSTQKVYFLYDIYDTVSNRLLYDFSKTVGDTITVFYFDTWEIKWAVVGEGLDSVGSEQRRYMDLKRVGWNYYDRWIEGIGSTRGFFAPIDEPSGWFEHSFQMVCFSDIGAGIQYEPLAGTKYNCNTPAHVFSEYEQTMQVEQIEIYPNPFNRDFTIENTTTEPCSYVLTTASGQIIKRSTLEARKKQMVSVPNLPVGLYLINYQINGRVGVLKLVCQY